MNYYAHTAEDDQGNPLSETSWQPLAAHLSNVAALARRFSEPYSLAVEAELAGLLHDCVKDSLTIGTGN